MTKIYKSTITKKQKFGKNICFLLKILCMFGPLVYFTIQGFITAEPSEKYTLALTSVAAIIIGLISAMRHINLKSTLYILMIGLWVALDRILPFIITVAICTILEELIFTPLYNRLNEDYHTNVQMDKRLGAE